MSKEKSKGGSVAAQAGGQPERPNVFRGAWRAITKGGLAVKLSMLIMGAGYIARKQYIKALLVTVFQALVNFFVFAVGAPCLKKFGTLGTVKLERVLNLTTGKNEFNNYDNSFTILLFSVITICVIAGFIFAWMANLRVVYELEEAAARGKHINSFREDIKDYLNKKFHITLLSLPVAGVVIFTVVPLVILIAIAFTNYDSNHMPPEQLFTWVGLENFKRLFTSSLSVSFGYSFKRVLIWTLVWAFFATFTTYFLGIMLAKFLNNKKTKLPKLWRTLFVVTIAVPQFVTLLIIRNFLANSGIVNTIFSNAGITDFLKSIGLVSEHLTYVPFLTSAGWAMVMIILINIWVGVPYQMLIATGVLMNIPADMIESARIDGANSWQSFWRITMPYMFAVTGPTLVTDFVKNINNFNVIYLLTQDMYVTTDQLLANSSAKEVDLLVTWLFRLTQESYNYKMASVIGIFVFIICAVFTLVAFRFLTRGDKEKEFQ